MSLKNSELFIILGASDNPLRPSYLAEKLLSNKGFKTLQVAAGDYNPSSLIPSSGIISIFLKPSQQKRYYDFIMSLKPSRIIFNPGTENAELIELAKKNNINTTTGCTIAMLMNKLI